MPRSVRVCVVTSHSFVLTDHLTEGCESKGFVSVLYRLFNLNG